MNEQVPSLLGEAFVLALRDAIREEIRAAMQNGHKEEDRLLDPEEAASVLSVSTDWLYRHAKKLPFTRKLGPKMLRFSAQGIQRYLLAQRKLP